MGNASCSRCCRCILLQLAVLLLFISSYIIPANVMAAVWAVNTAISVSENYSDNIQLTEESTQISDLVTVVKPSFFISAKGSRVVLGLDYFLQNTDYNREKVENSTIHNYKFNADAEPVRGELLLSAKSARSQAVLDRSVLEQRNRLIRNDISNVDTYSISPTYKKALFGEAALSLSYSIQQIKTDSEIVSDNENYYTDVSLVSLSKNSKLQWNIEYFSTLRKRDTLPDSESSSGEIEIYYRLFKSIFYVATAGFVENEANSVGDGSYRSVGLGWHPSEKFTLDLFAGNSLRKVDLSVRPSNRSSLDVSWTDLEVGLNPGVRLEGKLALKSRNVNLLVSRFEEVTNFQQLLASDQQGNQLASNITPSSSIFIRSRSSASLTIKRSRINFSLNVFVEDRHFVETSIAQNEIDSDSKGGNAELSWAVSPRFTISLIGGIEDISIGKEADRIKFSAMNFSHTSRRNLSIVARVQRTQQIGGLIGSIDYIENIAQLDFSYSF